mgnify:CR=1 FL=1
MQADRRQVLQQLCAVAATAGLGVAGPARAQSAAAEAVAPPLPAVGSPLRLPQVALLDGGSFSPAQADGKVTVIYWWASTCPFCAQQSPEMQKLWSAFRSKGLQMLALSVDKTPKEAEAYLQKKGYTFPSGWASPEIQKVFPKPKGLPITLVRGRDGRVLQAEKGQLFPEDVEGLARWLA